MTRDEDTTWFWEQHDKDSYECPRCGRGHSEVLRFEVHHKDGHPENGQPDNLVALCQLCHYDEHGIDPGKHRGHWSEEYFNEYRSTESPLKYL